MIKPWTGVTYVNAQLHDDTVTVACVYNEYSADIEITEVMYNGVDVLPILGDLVHGTLVEKVYDYLEQEQYN